MATPLSGRLGPQIGRRVWLAASLATPLTLAMGRTPVGGHLRWDLPWQLSGLDPHSPYDFASALFAPAVFDSLYDLDGQGRPYPSLAVDAPVASNGGLMIRLRSGLQTSRARSLSAREVVHSLQRAKSAGNRWLGALGEPTLVPGDPLAVRFSTSNSRLLTQRLASPLAAIASRQSTAIRPDGTGSFRVSGVGRQLVLVRNLRAARGSAFLERMSIRSVADLRQSLKSFESGSTDIGWLGAGLYKARSQSIKFQLPSPAWVVLRTGKDAGAWGAPGAAQLLSNAVPAAQLGAWGVRREFSPNEQTRWGGYATTILVPRNEPQLLGIAQSVAGALSTAMAPLTVDTTANIAAKRQRRDYSLMLDVVRNPRVLGGTAEALYAADGARLTRAGSAATKNEYELTRLLRLGVLGELEFRGATIPSMHGISQPAMGDWWLAPSKP